MNKAANIYWDNATTAKTARRTAVSRNRPRAKADAATRRTFPWWASCLIVTSIFVMLLVSINFRAFTEMREEVNQNLHLAGQVQNLMDENLALQEEIHALKTDPRAIQREAKKIGVDLRPEKVPVPAN